MESSPSFLRTYGLVAGREAWLGWILLGTAAVVVLVVSALVLAGALRRGPPEPGMVEREGDGLRWIVIGGIVVPSLILVSVLVLTVTTQAAIATPAGADLTVRVTGRQWWWEVRYLARAPSLIATTANEIHIPVGRPVRLEVVTGDVIHSFWIPELAGKTDQIPGQENVMWLEADRPGVYHGQCAEYCGLQHAKMAIEVVAEPPDAFARWLERQRAPAAAPAGTAAAAGAKVFATRACALCHTVRGTMAGGRLGPDLTHFAGRRTIAAGTVANTSGNLVGWIENPQAFKPGTLMPAVPLEGRALGDLTSYLQSLH
jgi:cytochrome c oxidase subunit II